MAGTTKKVLGDSQVVVLRGNYSEGLGDIQATRDAMVAVCQEVQDLYDMVDTAADFNALKVAMAARGPLKYVRFTY